MKKAMLILIIIILLIGVASMISVYAKNSNNGNQSSDEEDDTEEQEQEGNLITQNCEEEDDSCCLGENCSVSSVLCVQGWAPKFKGCDKACKPKVVCQLEKKVKNTTFVPWQKRNESECQEGCKCRGAVMSCKTETGRNITIEAGRSGKIIIITIVRGQDDNEVEDDEEDIEVNTTLEIETENEGNKTKDKTKIKAKLSNGREAEIKIMPDTASDRAVERLGELNFTIQLKEVGKGNNTQLAYELQAERHYRILILFKAKALVKAEIDAETGEIIVVKKPWWAFLAKED